VQVQQCELSSANLAVRAQQCSFAKISHC